MTKVKKSNVAPVMGALLLGLLFGVLSMSCTTLTGSCPPCPPCPTCPGAGEVPVPTAAPIMRRGELDIIDMSFKRDSIGSFIVMGIVKNEGDITANRIQVSCTAYDSGHHLVDTHTTYPELTSLGPGQETTFTCYLDEVSPIDSYECVVQW
jgi:hypothetical protein